MKAWIVASHQDPKSDLTAHLADALHSLTEAEIDLIYPDSMPQARTRARQANNRPARNPSSNKPIDTDALPVHPSGI